MIAGLWMLVTASAQQEACDTVYDRTRFQVAIDAGREHVEKAELDEALAVLKEAYLQLPCLDTLVDRAQLASFARWNALAAFYQQDEVGTIRWGRLARSADPENANDGMPEALIAILEEAGDPGVGRPDTDMGLMLPKKGAVFLNGRLLLKLEAKVEVPYLVQVFDGSGHPVRGHWQDGSAFPPDLLGTDPPPLKNPRWYNPVTNEVTTRGSAPKIGELPPPRTGGSSSFPVMPVVGAGLLVAGGALYAVAGLTEGRLKCDAATEDGCPTTSEELTRLRSTANLLTFGAGGLAVGGIALGVGGLLLDGGGGLVVGGRF